MSDHNFRLLPEGYATADVLDDPLFTDITHDGEIYTLYRVVRLTHSADDHPDGWTHRANVARVHEQRIGVALLRIVDRVITKSTVTLSTEPE